MAENFDIIVEKGTIVDGTGGRPRRSDLGIAGNAIRAVDDLKDASAERRIDAGGKIVCPGFIDAHCHTDAHALYYPDAEAKVMQGVTTDVCGLCGSSAVPTGSGHLDEYRRRNENAVPGMTRVAIEPQSFGEYLAAFDARGNSTNAALFAGNANLRIHACGYEDKKALPGERDLMKEMLRRSMEEGALGLSSGLTYVPSMFAPTEELTELCGVLRPFGGVYNSHMRNEGDRVLDSIAEVVEIAKGSGCRGHVSHLKVTGAKNHGTADRCLDLIERANASGVPVSFDVYPYAAASMSLKTLLPPWVLSHGLGDGCAILLDQRDRILADLGDDSWDNILLSCGAERIVVSSTGLARYEGKSLAQITEETRGKEPYDALALVLRETEGRAGMICHSMSEDDVRTFLRNKRCMVGSDAFARHYAGPTACGRPHPRNYGAFPRFLRRFVLDEGLMSLEEGIYRMTGLPAETFGLEGRGVLKEGFAADVTIFDPKTIEDSATWESPAQKPRGVEWVLVNGRVSVDRGEFVGARAGRGLRLGNRL